ncbi:MAG: hypothetical protein LBM16_05660 [Clostridiales bacterium]|jgi:hypothetical protein|nr:hypothetical protein [Clostridiales bacterium]
MKIALVALSGVTFVCSAALMIVTIIYAVKTRFYRLRKFTKVGDKKCLSE